MHHLLWKGICSVVVISFDRLDLKRDNQASQCRAEGRSSDDDDNKRVHPLNYYAPFYAALLVVIRSIHFCNTPLCLCDHGGRGRAKDTARLGWERETDWKVLAAVEYYLGRGVVSFECPQELIRWGRRRKEYCCSRSTTVTTSNQVVM